MNTFEKSLIFNLIFKITALVFVFSGVFIGLYHQSTASVVEATTNDLLNIRISTPQIKFVQHEPIPLTFRLSNLTAHPISWEGLLDFGDRVNLVMRTTNGVETRYKGDRGLSYPSVSFEVMQPGENKEVQRLIDESFAERLFPQPGLYQFQAEFIYFDSSSGERERKLIISDPIIVEIEEPRGRNLLAYRYLRNVLAPTLNLAERTEELRIREYFSRHFNDTIYSKYKAFELGNLYLSLGQNAKAEDEFFSISDIDFYHAKRIEIELSGLAIKLGRPYRRTKRQPPPVDIPFPVPRPAPTAIIHNPPPPDGPVLIPIPNPTP